MHVRSWKKNETKETYAMKALQISQYGASDVLDLYQNAPKPVPAKE